MKPGPTATIEDYLGIIYTLERDGEKVIGARLSDILDVSPPTVTVTLQRMVRDGWISLDSRKHVHLTSQGKEAAHTVIRRHMLTEWLLSRVLHVPLSDLHDEAHRIEHSISSQVEQKLAATMEDPEVCPHGNPLPGLENVSNNWKPLNSFGQGDEVVLRRIHELLEEDHAVMKSLADAGIQPGQQTRIIASSTAGSGLRIAIHGKEIELDGVTAEKIFAEIAS